MTRAYLGGKMRGLPDLGFSLFDAAATKLRAAGWEIICPAEHDREMGIDPATWQEDPDATAPLLYWDLQQIGDPATECVIMLDNFEDSQGAACEIAFAKALPKPVYVYVDRGSWTTEPLDYWLENYGRSPERRSGSVCDNARLLVGDDDPNAALAAAGRRYQETRVVNETTGGAKGQKLARFDLIPSEPMWSVAEHYGRGARKYADRNWELGYNWSLSYGAMQRHLHQFWSGESIDEETGGHHLSAAVFHCLALLEFERTHPELDDRPTPIQGTTTP